MWTVVMVIVSVIALFVYSGDPLRVFGARMWFSVGAGVGSVLIGLLAAVISLQLPWMRSGWAIGPVLNSLACAAIAALAAFLICGFILTFMQNDPYNQPSQSLIQTTYDLMWGGIIVSAFWGLVYGSWFALRRDKYFVESI